MLLACWFPIELFGFTGIVHVTFTIYLYVVGAHNHYCRQILFKTYLIDHVKMIKCEITWQWHRSKSSRTKSNLKKHFKFLQDFSNILILPSDKSIQTTHTHRWNLPGMKVGLLRGHTTWGTERLEARFHVIISRPRGWRGCFVLFCFIL